MIFKIVKNYFIQSYKQSKVAFYCELCEAVLVGGASLKVKDFLAIYTAGVKHLNKSL